MFLQDNAVGSPLHWASSANNISIIQVFKSEIGILILFLIDSFIILVSFGTFNTRFF